jgi:hypothetical protein
MVARIAGIAELSPRTDHPISPAIALHEIMRSDGPLQADEQNILSTLALTLELPDGDCAPLLALMEVLHAPVH